MPVLLRCRTPLSELAELFQADTISDEEAEDEIWPGGRVHVLVLNDGQRQIRSMNWALPPRSFMLAAPVVHRSTLFPRDLQVGSGRLASGSELARCLILAEGFGYPRRRNSTLCRTWAGLKPQPVGAWAGIWDKKDQGAGCAGLLTAANSVMAAVSEHMPALLQPAAHDAWLGGTLSVLEGSIYPSEAWHFEVTSEKWAHKRPAHAAT